MRVPIAYFKEYGEAQGLKHQLQEEFPDKVFQVRARKDRKEYLVVERTYHPVHNPEKLSATKLRKKRRGTTI